MHDPVISSAVSTLDNSNPRTKGYGTLGAPLDAETIMKYGAVCPRSLASARASYSPRFFRRRTWRQIERSNAWKIDRQERIRIHGLRNALSRVYKGQISCVNLINSVVVTTTVDAIKRREEGEGKDLQHPSFLGCDDAQTRYYAFCRDVL